MQIKRRLITESPEELLLRYGSDIMEDPRFLKWKSTTHHLNSNTYDHSVLVTLAAIEYAKNHKIKVEPASLVRGCLLHDYFCYDCHEKGRSPLIHMVFHGPKAAKNAMKDFGVNPIETDMITNHMWPVNPFLFPLCREGWILTWADKKVSVKERFGKKSTVLDN